MIKKIHLRLIKALIGPFIASFAITMFLFLMHFLWLYIDEIIGKGLSSWVFIKLLMLTTASLVPMALPLAVLLSALMAYGDLAEHFEIVAIKSSGISLLKTLLPNFIFITFIAIGAFFFVNYVIPRANLESKSLLWDVRNKKPAFNIEEGVFYDDIEGYSIKVGKKLADDESIEDIIIYEQKYTSEQINVIKAKSGRMYLSANKKLLYFTLNNGIRYEEMTDQANYSTNNQSNTTSFEKQEMVFDLSALDLKKTEKELFKGDYRMQGLNDLNANIDSTEKDIEERNNFQKDYMKSYYRVFDTAVTFVTIPDSMTIIKDTGFLSRIPVSVHAQVIMAVQNSLRMQRDICENTINANKENEANRILYLSERHKKVTLSVLILILFLIAAPLGTIIRKGGLGMPLVISVVMFIIYYVVNLIGEKMAKEGVWNLTFGMWFAIVVFAPIAIFIYYKAAIDSALFDADVYKKFFRKLKLKIGK